ncbi:MAG: SAM-dependent methyltransferase [Bacteroidetes bacterium]|nr:MAG: SAM-dependent methyltransferase [Bacteroidota bacterium]MBL1145638.1 SAM-dependent methyltransferase [Bacteroidota bacterium]NOG58432.1 tRNA (5-methylaminomethyl-2-thiouridine)(34)-methyltransferase MnmD [Bacteroidota bacterium]
MKKELVITKDGSNSFYIKEIDEHYHSINGSIAESEHIFIRSGLLEIGKKLNSINLLEVGMGTGLNVLKTALALQKSELKVNYTALEAYPLSWEETSQLNYTELIQEENAKTYFQLIHQSEWNKSVEINECLKLLKVNKKLEEMEFNSAFDLIYFDAFAPEKQAEMWTAEIFAKLYDSMTTGGILVTYCVKGVVRRTLQAVGFQLEKLPGPIGGKREILRAMKS